MKEALAVIVLCLFGISVIILRAYINGKRKNRIGLSRRTMDRVANVPEIS